MLLEDESKKRAPSHLNLHNMIIRTCGYKKELNIDALKFKNSNMAKSPEYCFVIRHFSKDVCYSTVIYIIF